ncbi:MAG: hypothetical protein NTX33_09480 [Propionibacteriales bacterium]|nr:hypothetical protein [Propionibacteriales bacterium]
MDRSAERASVIAELKRFRGRRDPTEQIDVDAYPHLFHALGGLDATGATSTLRALLTELALWDRSRQALLLSMFAGGATVQDRMQAAADVDFVDVRTIRRLSDSAIDGVAGQIVDLAGFARMASTDLAIVPYTDDVVLIALHTSTPAESLGRIRLATPAAPFEGTHVEYDEQWTDDAGRVCGRWTSLVDLDDLMHERDRKSLVLVPHGGRPSSISIRSQLSQKNYSFKTTVLRSGVMIDFLRSSWTDELKEWRVV